MANYEKRVQRGIAFLDSMGPEGWREMLNLETLDLSHTHSCVFGQIFTRDVSPEDIGWVSGFWVATHDRFPELNGDFKKLRKLGFEADEPDESYAETTEAWKRAIKNGN